jgi:hypothetical protein
MLMEADNIIVEKALNRYLESDQKLLLFIHRNANVLMWNRIIVKERS